MIGKEMLSLFKIFRFHCWFLKIKIEKLFLKCHGNICQFYPLFIFNLPILNAEKAVPVYDVDHWQLNCNENSSETSKTSNLNNETGKQSESINGRSTRSNGTNSTEENSSTTTAQMLFYAFPCWSILFRTVPFHLFIPFL